MNKNTEKRSLTLNLEEAWKLYGKNPEMDSLLLSSFTKEELTKKEMVDSWAKLGTVVGFFINSKSDIVSFRSITDSASRNTFVTQKQAKSALAQAQLSQLMKDANGDWKPDWNNDNSPKYVINRSKDRLVKDYYYDQYNFLAFETSDIRDSFLLKHERLLKDYFELD